MEGQVLQLAAALVLAAVGCLLVRRVARWAATLRALSKLPRPEMSIVGCMDMMADPDHISHVNPPPPASRRRVQPLHLELPNPDRRLTPPTFIVLRPQHPVQTFTRFANELGDIFYVRVLHVPMVIVADPALWQAALAPGIDLPKGRSVYGIIDQVRAHTDWCLQYLARGQTEQGGQPHDPPAVCCAASPMATPLQMTSPGGRHPNLLGHHTHTGYWRLVRKGVAPAFNPRNIR